MDNASCINWQNCTTNLASGSDKLVGWVPESPGRGTLSLLSTCLATLCLCTWVIIHPRIDPRRRFRPFHRLVLSLKALLAPELIAVESAQEWMQVRKMVRSCKELTSGDFGPLHAFYIGMFGVRYRTPEGTRVLWPNQFIWLLEEGLFKWQDRASWSLGRENIRDKNKADEFAKLIALGQVALFVVQSVIRLAKGLPLAPFESMTLSYIPLFGLTYFFWWSKPKDVETPSEIDLPDMTEAQAHIFESMAITHDFDSEGSPRQMSYWVIWYLTPRIFEKVEKERIIELAAQNTIKRQLMTEEGRPILQRAKPLSWKSTGEIVISHWDPDLYHSKSWPMTCFFGVSFPALHLLSWDGTFPTIFELWLWRGAAIASIATLLIFMHKEKVVIRWRNPWTLAQLIAPAIYLLSRGVMLVEAVIAFRASNPAIYETYIIGNY